MKKTLKLRMTAAAVIIALLAVFVCAIFVAMPFARADESRTAPLVYADDARTVLKGIDEEGFDTSAEFSVIVPASVTEIEIGAFTGLEKLVNVTFEAGSQLGRIGDFAFAGTGITEIVFPASLKTIGAAAFSETKLSGGIMIPQGVKEIGKRAFGNIDNVITFTVTNTEAEYGEAAFDAGSYIVAQDRAAFDALKADPGFSGYDNELTYPITVEYSLLGYVIASEQRLYGCGYDVELINGVCTVVQNPTFGTAATAGMTWFATADASGDALDIDALSGLLKSDELDGDTLTVYATSKGSGKAFFARNNIVYNGVQYALDDLSGLLAPVSDSITPSMIVTIEKYADADGNVADERPITVGNAGHYDMKVADGSIEYSFGIDIARREVNLGETDVLEWKLTSVAGTQTVSELRNATGITLYIYERNDGTGHYPSRTILTDAEKIAYDLSDDYTARLVRNSVVRYRNANVTVGIAGGMLDEAYSIAKIDNDKTSSAVDVGAYTAGATIAATDNYTLVLNGLPTDNIARGIEIEVAADGRTAYVAKDWFIVNEGNRLVGENGEDYVIADRVYGDITPITMPRLQYGDAEAVNYGAAGDPVTLTLIYNGNTIVGAETFTRRELYAYVNDAMPAGEYQLRIRAEEVVSVEFDEDDVNHERPNNIAHAGFDETVSFTVGKRAVDSVMTERIDRVIKDNTFTYMYDGNSHFYNETAAETIGAALSDYSATVSRYGTVWENSVYDGLFGDYEITFNLARMLSDTYYSANSMPVKTSDPDKYTVYYKVSAPNYLDSYESADAARTEYRFYVVNVMSVNKPDLRDKTYDGTPLIADIADNLVYVVTSNVGGTNVGVYDVELTLREPEFYMWEGDSLDERSASTTVTFEVLAANNRWDVEPGVTFWVEGKYDPAENSIFGAPRFGTAAIVITDSSDNVVYNSVTGLNKLDGLAAGTYRLSATVTATGNYDGLSFSMFVNVFEKPGMPWWGILLIVIGALIVVAIIILILWKKGVFQILTGKLVLAIRTKATIDATIAAVRAGRIAEQSKASVADAEARDKAKERAEARKAAAEAERAKSAEEKAAELEAKAQSEVERADKIKAKAEAMQARAAAMKIAAAEKNESAPEDDNAAADEAAAAEQPEEQPDNNTEE